VTPPPTVGTVERAAAAPTGLRAHEYLLAAPRSALIEPLVVGLVVAAVGFVAGALLIDHGTLPPATTAELARVEAALDGNLPGSLVSEQPILFTLMVLPAALVGGANLLLVLPSALAGGAIAAVLDAAQRGRRVTMPLRLAATAVAVLNPVSIYLMASGLPTLPAAACVAIGLYGILEWIRTRDLRWLLASSLLFATGALFWYPVLIWSLAAMMTLILVSIFFREGPEGIAGVLILYAFPLLVAAGLWTLAVERTVGESVPWVQGDPLPGTDLVMDLPTFLVLAGPCVLAVAIAIAALAQRRPPSTWATVGWLILTPFVVIVAWRAVLGEPTGLGTNLFLVIPFAAVLFTAMVQAELRRGRRIALYSVVIALLLVATGAAAAWVAGSPEPLTGPEAPAGLSEAFSSIL
jgi:hypothetical protein